MRILILGAGKMGSFFTDLLSFNHDVAVLEKDPRRMRFIYNAQRFTSPEEIADFRPELLINCVTLNATLQAFEEVFPYLPKECIISDIASVKTGLQEFMAPCKNVSEPCPPTLWQRIFRSSTIRKPGQEKVSLSPTTPSSSPAAAVMILKVEPGS